MVESPILFITFVRPEYARRSWDAIKAARPKKLYFYSNKGRSEKEGEIERNEEIRSFINEIDWDCDLHTFFREKCVDIYTSLWGAMDWLFEKEESGIIIEEDCVATKAFFQFCDDLLPRYANNPKVRMITGNNYTPEYNPKGVDYFFSHITNIYGWASWRDRWQGLDRKMTNWDEVKNRPMRKYFPTYLCYMWYKLNMQRIYDNIDTSNPWDFITLYNSIKNDQCSIIPKCNLVWDIGVSGSHHKTKKREYKYIAVPNIDSIKTSHYSRDTSVSYSYDSQNFYHHILKRVLKYFPKRILQKIFCKK